MRYIISTSICLAILASGCATQRPMAYPTRLNERRLLLAHSIPADVPYGSIYEVRVYIVTRGDTATKISEQFHMTREQLAALNPDAQILRLKVGQRLVVNERTTW